MNAPPKCTNYNAIHICHCASSPKSHNINTEKGEMWRCSHSRRATRSEFKKIKSPGCGWTGWDWSATGGGDGGETGTWQRRHMREIREGCVVITLISRNRSQGGKVEKVDSDQEIKECISISGIKPLFSCRALLRDEVSLVKTWWDWFLNRFLHLLYYACGELSK